MRLGCPLELLITGGRNVRVVPWNTGEEMGTHVPVPAQADLTEGTLRFEVIDQLWNAWQHQLQVDHPGDGTGHKRASQMLRARIPCRVPEEERDSAAKIGDHHHVKTSGVGVEQREFRRGKPRPPAPASRVDRLNQPVDHQGSEEEGEDIAP